MTYDQIKGLEIQFTKSVSNTEEEQRERDRVG
jgi:hypothetical protein